MDSELLQLTLQLRNRKDGDKKYAKFHGDQLIGNQVAKAVGLSGDLQAIFSVKNWPALAGLLSKYFENGELDGGSAAKIAGSLSNYSTLREKFIDSQVKSKYDKMLHPPLTYLGDAFQYRTADGKFNSALNPHLGQAGAPYAKTVPSKTAPLGALPSPEDVFDKLMARKEGGRVSESGLSSMLIYHATIIIHDIFRTNDNDKNISDSSSYLDLSPLYGFTMKMQREIRDSTYKLGLLKPDTFAEDRLLRQPPGVCVMLVMYNRYHNYAAKQLYRINENNRFRVPSKYEDTLLVSMAKNFHPPGAKVPVGLKTFDAAFLKLCENYNTACKQHEAKNPDVDENFHRYEKDLEIHLQKWAITDKQREEFKAGYDVAWNKLDDDLFNTARLITCGQYINISVHDYLRALMGFHAYDTNFTLDPRNAFDTQTTRGLGNQVTVEFNLLYRFHCAISRRDEKYTEDYLTKEMNIPPNASLQDFLMVMAQLKEKAKTGKETMPWETTFGIPGDEEQHFVRNKVTNLFDDKQMVDALTSAMDDPISNFGPCNIPKCLKPVEIMGILQARRWETGSLNDFRSFFGMPRHESFESISKNVEIQNALRDLYEHPDKVELYPGIFCESDEFMGLDPGPRESSSALWTAIFSDAITLVRSDRFYTVDWNTNSLTSWGMNEVTPNNEICKSSVFHRLIQRAFPGWFPYDSLRFFQPFYTAKTNEKYAREQGYAPDFRLAPPLKPVKPVRLTDFEDIAFVLNDTKNAFVHPALLLPSKLPQPLADVMKSDYRKAVRDATLGEHQLESEPALRKYLENLMRSIVKRESIAMTNATFQIDATRDFAIPVVTRYIADFLGFGHQLRTEDNPTGLYSENLIYQHINNAQVFLSYNPDETKMMARSKAFSKSMAFLMELALQGNIASANKWDITRAIFGDRSGSNPMTHLGFGIARRILDFEQDVGKAAAILLLVCLDFANNSVVSFTAVLDRFMTELYEAAARSTEPRPTWLGVQDLAFSGVDEIEQVEQAELEAIVQRTAWTAVRLPIIRVAKNAGTFAPKNGTRWSIEQNQTMVLDIQEATVEALKSNKTVQVEYLHSHLGAASKFGAYQPRRFATLALTSMIGFIARMKNVRRGHDAQGKLKQIHLGWTAEGYSNFMASERMEFIHQQVRRLPDTDENKDIFTMEVLKPATDTYLTPSWDEMVPFPMTWKIRFDGFGASDYSVAATPPQPYGKIKTPWLPDDAPPWYQPQGASHDGGSFADTVCHCVSSDKRGDKRTAAEREPTLSTGCGLLSHHHG